MGSSYGAISEEKQLSARIFCNVVLYDIPNTSSHRRRKDTGKKSDFPPKKFNRQIITTTSVKTINNNTAIVVYYDTEKRENPKKKNLPKCRQIDSARAYPPFYLCAGDRARWCVRACAGCACGSRPGSTNSRRNARVYHAATAADDSVRGRFRRRPNVEAAAAAGSSNPATQQKPLCVGGALERSLDRSFACSSLFSPQRARRSRTTTARATARQCKRHDKNAAAARDRCKTHSSVPPLFTGRHRHHLQRRWKYNIIICNTYGREQGMGFSGVYGARVRAMLIFGVLGFSGEM
ncbi:Uncharacterized protein FWK35_00035707 [Aphis craccivora]|uniref:Uncharacterized protein n=1 Tax=Aphis craccivora TaxID=307492 RepID=A0A6G0XR65_APHCR|nr:Uncharacterized protein FWK35_00035707 [Aphis craccivora]